jgi:hypothetical protein
MELVAQVSRESLTTAAALEKVGFRIQETEEKFSQLVVDQESRLARLERLVDEQSARSTADRESARQAVLELEERFRAFREEEAESRRRMAAELDEFRKLREETEERQGRVSAELEGALRTAREERERERSAGQDLRGLLAESLTEIVSRLRRDDSAS